MREAQMDEPQPQVMLEVVEATMSSPMFSHEPVETGEPREPAEPVDPGTAPAIPPERPTLQPLSLPPRVELERELAIAVAVAIVSSFVASDIRVAIVVGSLAFATVGIRRIDRRLSFSFGEGFIGYRADLGWPRGVQEDDDVRWNWRASAAAHASPGASRGIFVNPMDKAARGR
jgi:hypothetical protein